MNRAPLRLTAVLTHPIQYYAPWFRHIVAHAPELALTVVHATQPTPAQQGVGFDRAFTWDVPLTEGYTAITVRPPRQGDRIDSSHFAGLDVPEIGQAIAGTKPDVVLISGWYSVTLVRALVTCRRRGISTLYRGDSHLLSGPIGGMRLPWMLKTRLLLRQFDGFLSPGERVDEYMRWFDVPEHRIFRIPHSVDNALFAATAAPYEEPAARAAARRRFGIDPNAFVPLFVGKLVRSKRPLDIVAAVARLGPGVSMLVVGSGALEPAMRAEAASLGVDLKLVGFMNQTQVGEAYGIADCLVLPSDFPETWGLVVNEAMAAGLPCVVSDAVGCGPDLIHDGDTGYVYPLGNIERLAEAFAKVRHRKADRYDWSTRCREVVSAYNFDAMTAGLVRACRSVLVHSASPEPDWTRPAQRVIACCGQMVMVGGVERMTFELLGALRDRGAATHVIVNGWESFRITPLAEDAGATWSVGPYWHALTRRPTPAQLAKMMLEVLRVSLHLVWESRRIAPTHILAPDYQVVLRNSLALVWLRARGVRVIARLGNAPEPGPLYRFVWRRLVSPLVDVFVCNSEFTRRELLAHGIPAEKTMTIANMVPTRRDPPAAVTRVPGRVIYVGQIIPEKGLDLLLDAMGLLRAKGLDTTLDVVGDIDGWEAPEFRGYRARLRARAAQPDLAGAVAFLGYREDVPTLLARASVHCCPSRPEIREGFGIVVLEAKQARMPSIVLPSGNLPELIDHGHNGWVCTEATAAALAEGIDFFLSDADRLVTAGKAAYESATRGSGDFAAQWCDVFGLVSRNVECA